MAQTSVSDSNSYRSHFFIDLHCHPSIKAFARSFGKQVGVQSTSPNDITSMYHRDAPALFDKIKNYALGITNFIQSDANSLLQGNVSVVFLSFYPPEKGFFVNKLGQRYISDTLTKLATEFGEDRINDIQARTSYWDDLRKEMAFVKQLHDKTIKLNGKNVSYRLASSFEDITDADKSGRLGNDLIVFVPTIEGGHVFDQMVDCHEPWEKYEGGIPDDRLDVVVQRIGELREQKNSLIRPFFLTLSHHFWNGLGGHERSLGGMVKCVVDQENGLGKPLSKAGAKVIQELLCDKMDSNGNVIPKILIDVKHMSYDARRTYYSMLKNELSRYNIPIIASHAGVTGLPEPGGRPVTPAANEGLYMQDAINLFDHELLEIELTKGVMGIQLDERRIGSKMALRHARGNIGRRDVLYSWAKLVWNQVRHVAEVLDMNGRFAWGIQCLGTDFDGIIDPINGYWTSRELDNLDDYLLKHAYNYLTVNAISCPLKQMQNRNINPEEVVDRVMTSNALNFLEREFK